jgi:hypothetical protein
MLGIVPGDGERAYNKDDFSDAHKENTIRTFHPLSANANKMMNLFAGSLKTKPTAPPGPTASLVNTAPHSTAPTSAPASIVTLPKGGANSGQTFKGHGGRKLVGKEKNSQSTTNMDERNAAKSPRTRVGNNMDDLARMLENDELALLNMKKDITEVQKIEIAKGRKQLMEIKKEHDAIFIINTMREKEVKDLHDRCKTLEHITEVKEVNGSAASNKLKSLNSELEESLESLAAEQRTLKMQNHMLTTLHEEIAECRIESGNIIFEIEKTNHEVGGVEGTLRLSKQELSEQEKILTEITSTLKNRKEQREEKMGHLNSMVIDGEMSIAKLQNTIDSPPRSRGGGSKGWSKGGRTNLSSFGFSSATHESLVQENITTTVVNKNCNLSETIQEIIERYKSRSTRMEKLNDLDEDLREYLTNQKEKKILLTGQLEQTAARHQQLASSRQVYQEVDMKDTALAVARKECDECKEREFRLKKHLESLKRSFPRFLTKITKMTHPIPSDDQLPDAVHKLEDEISKLVKTIDTALLKDATAEDVATISQQTGTGGEVTSEIGRLQKLPGYSRLQRQLFFNLMSARPDTTDKNVRIISTDIKKIIDNEAGNYNVGSAGTGKKFNPNGTHGGTTSNLDTTQESNSLDRDTIKNISKLIVERDSQKFTTKVKKTKKKQTSFN